MAIFTKFIPESLIDVDDDTKFEFFTQEELLNLFCVKCWTKHPDSTIDKNFHRFSLKGNILVVESFEGKFHIEIGSISDISSLTLPIWKAV